jgi:hypothetical protein
MRGEKKTGFLRKKEKKLKETFIKRCPHTAYTELFEK